MTSSAGLVQTNGTTFVPSVDEGLDGADEVLDGCEDAAPDRLAGDDREEDL
jgi:hypothetical protein